MGGQRVKPKVLIGYSACPLTREAFERAGCEAWTCDTLPSRDGNTTRHIQSDIRPVLRLPCWDFALLHPMCTFLTVSAAWAYGDGPYHQKVKPSTLVGAARRAARDDALDNFRMLLSLPYPCAIENPSPSFINKAIRPPNQVIQPYDFGDNASKSTGLWLTRGVPLLQATSRFPPRLVCSNKHTFAYGLHKCPVCASGKYLPRWGNQTDTGQNRLGPSDDNRWLERSKTYPGIAAAMGAQWGLWLHTRSS